MDRIQAAGANFCSLTENIDTGTAAGRMMMQIVGSFAEFEREMLRERTRAGLAAAKKQGRVGGRRPNSSPPVNISRLIAKQVREGLSGA